MKAGPPLLEALGNADIFYEMQYKEVKIVANVSPQLYTRFVHILVNTLALANTTYYTKYLKNLMFSLRLDFRSSTKRAWLVPDFFDQCRNAKYSPIDLPTINLYHVS